MEFSFKVDPNQDLAIGAELSFEECEGDFEGDFDFTGVNPLDPTGAKPGSEDKVKMLAARYAAGVPLWHSSDCYDHGPTGSGLLEQVASDESFLEDEDEEEDF